MRPWRTPQLTPPPGQQASLLYFPTRGVITIRYSGPVPLFGWFSPSGWVARSIGRSRSQQRTCPSILPTTDLSLYSPDSPLYSPGPPIRLKPSGETRELWQVTLPGFFSPLVYL